MAQEHRQITLSNREALLALDAHRRAVAGFLPSGEILSFKMKPDGDMCVIVKMMYGKSAHELEIDFKLADILPVLHQFCTENNIQIPAHSRRLVKCDGDTLALVLINDI